MFAYSRLLPEARQTLDMKRYTVLQDLHRLHSIVGTQARFNRCLALRAMSIIERLLTPAFSPSICESIHSRIAFLAGIPQDSPSDPPYFVKFVTQAASITPYIGQYSASVKFWANTRGGRHGRILAIDFTVPG
jgi:hypothetical protein